MSVTLAFARDEKGVLRHIRDRLSRSQVYTCPFCLAKVRARKGQEREHHFAHEPGTSCAASDETILHFNAKHYLARCIRDEDSENDVILQVPLELLDDYRISGVLSALLMKAYSLSLTSLTGFYHGRDAKVESAVGPYIADVVMLNSNNRIGCVFEIVVSHKMDPEKLQFLQRQQIPYLELEPIALEDNTFTFRVLQLLIPGYFNGLEKDFVKTSTELFYDEFYEIVKESIQTAATQRVTQSLKLQAWDWVTDRILYSRDVRTWVPDDVQQKMKEMTVKSFWETEIRSMRMCEAKTKKIGENRLVFALDDSGWEMLIYNDKVLLAELLTKLAVAYPMDMIIGKSKKGKEGVIGFRIHNLIDPESYAEVWKNNLESIFTDVRKRLANGIEDEME